MKPDAPDLITALGLLFVVAGVWTYSTPLALIVVGLLLVAAGLVIGRQRTISRAVARRE
jgi:hypothetical protein